MIAAAVVSLCLALPAHLGVTDPYRPPACDRCAGNRGLELATRPGDPVGAALDGVATFVGPVGGRLYVVLRSATDPLVRVTYGGLASAATRTGDTVATGDVVGVAGASLFFGVRVGERHVDPSWYLPADRGRPPHHGAAVSPPRFRVTLGQPTVAACAPARPTR